MGGPNRTMGTDPTYASDGSSSAPSSHYATDEAVLEPGLMVGEYQIDGLLGEGGMGRVYSAIHPVIGKRAAIKVLHPALSAQREAVERFVQEARAVNQIGHPNIIDIFSFGTLADGRSYFVMEQLRGESLGKRIERSQLPLVDILSILDTIAVALDAAHRKGIVHRDLKPDNVFLVEVEDQKPQVKLLDFGIAKLTGSEVRLERTRTGNVMGTPAYISPEQARGQGVDHRTDLYAFGALAHELLTGNVPFPATNAADMIAKHLFEPPPSSLELNPEVDLELDDLIKRLLAKDADERPTLEETREQLRACRNRVYQRNALHEGGHTDPVIDISRLDGRSSQLSIPGRLTTGTGIATPPREHKRGLLLFIAGGALVLSAIVGIVLWINSDASEPKQPVEATPPQVRESPPVAAEPPAPPAPTAAEPVAPAPAAPLAAAPVDAQVAPTTTAAPAKPATTAAPAKPVTTRRPARPTRPKPQPTKPPRTTPTPPDDPDAPM